MKLQTLGDAPRFGRLERIIQRTKRVRVEIVQHQADLLGVRVRFINQPAHLQSEVLLGATLGHLDMPPASFRLTEHEQIASAVKDRTLYLSGKDVGLFEHTASTDEDGFPHMVFKQRRPLPMGTYHFLVRARDAIDIPCGNHSQYGLRWMITATPPAGTLHELFFDPVNVDTTVAADGPFGVLKPASFTDANGASATVESISYVPPSSMSSVQVGTVKVKVKPNDALDDHILDFIELDGTVSLSLDVADATVDSANDRLSWSVASQPWEDGDKLMVRIREAR